MRPRQQTADDVILFLLNHKVIFGFVSKFPRTEWIRAMKSALVFGVLAIENLLGDGVSIK